MCVCVCEIQRQKHKNTELNATSSDLSRAEFALCIGLIFTLHSLNSRLKNMLLAAATQRIRRRWQTFCSGHNKDSSHVCFVNVHTLKTQCHALQYSEIIRIHNFLYSLTIITITILSGCGYRLSALLCLLDQFCRCPCNVFDATMSPSSVLHCYLHTYLLATYQRQELEVNLENFITSVKTDETWSWRDGLMYCRDVSTALVDESRRSRL